ncbi:MAG: hypothetical protein NTX22_05230 [Ignavibacteriales bacterium]|nr:hypothetical protein [Ignavibacteriales bacterium]
MKIRKILILLLFPSVFLAEGGSGYTRIGLGDIYNSQSARRISMGGLGTALFDKDNISDFNPASWTRLNITRFETGINVESFQTKDQTTSSFFSNSYFSGFVLGIPIQKDYGVSLVLGIVPYSRVKFLVSQTVNSDITHNLNFEGKGSVSKVFLGTSYSLPFDWNFGASLDYYVGNIDYVSNLIYLDENYLNSEYSTRYKLHGIGGTFGLISNDLSKSLGIDFIKNLRIGATLSISNKINVDTTETQTIYSGNKTSIVSTIDLAAGNTQAELPISFGTGLAFSSGKYLFVMDYFYQSWSNYKLRDLVNPDLQNLQKISAGVEYKISDDLSSSFWNSIILRGGINYEQTQYKVNGKGINQYSVLGGLTFPLDYTSSIDVSLEYGIRGTTDLNLLKENLLRFNLSINFGELWFLRSGR